MIKFELLRDAGVPVVEPKSALSAEDFSEISRMIDPYIREKGKLSWIVDRRTVLSWMGQLRRTY